MSVWVKDKIGVKESQFNDFKDEMNNEFDTALKDLENSFENQNKQIDEKFNDVNNKITEIEDTINTLPPPTDLTEVNRKITTNTNNISNLTTRVSTNETNIRNNTNNISSLTSRVKVLEGKSPTFITEKISYSTLQNNISLSNISQFAETTLTSVYKIDVLIRLTNLTNFNYSSDKNLSLQIRFWGESNYTTTFDEVQLVTDLDKTYLLCKAFYTTVKGATVPTSAINDLIRYSLFEIYLNYMKG